MSQRRSMTPSRDAFTLLELLVVVGIVALLAAVSLSIGPRVLDGQRAGATRNVIQALNRALGESIETNGGLPPSDPDDYAGVPCPYLTELSDSEETGPEDFGNPPRPHVRFPVAGVFLHQARGVPDAQPIIAGIPQRYIVSARRQPANNPEPDEPRIPIVLDAWGANADWEPVSASGAPDPFLPLLRNTPILFVHPQNILAQQLHGRCDNNRPYFMSAGADRLYGATAQVFPRRGTSTDLGVTDSLLRDRALGALKDNIYSYEPQPADQAPNSSFNATSR